MVISNQGIQTRHFSRLYWSNVIIVIMITIIPVVIYYQYFSKAYNEELEKFNEQTVIQIRQSIDQQFIKESINTLSRSVADGAQDSILLYPMTNSIRNDSSSVLNIISQIDSIQRNLSFVKSIDLYYKLDNVLFYDNKFCFLTDSSCDIGSRKQWLEQFQTTETQIDWLPPRPIQGSDSEKVITHVRSIPYFASKENKKAIIAINIYESALRKSLQSLKHSSDGILMILDEQGNVIAHNQENNPMDDLRNDKSLWLNRVLASNTNIMFNETIAGNSMMVSSAHSEYNSWRYVSMANKDLFYQKANELRNWLISLCFVFLLVSILTTLYLNKRAHRPIRSVLSDMHHKIEINKPIIRHNLIMSLLHDDIQPNRGQMGDILNIQPEWDHFFCFIIQISKKEDFESEQALSYHLIDLLQLKEEEEYRIWAIKDYGRRILGIVCFSELYKHEAMSVIEDKIQSVYGVEYMLSYGDAHPKGQRPVSTSYREAVEAQSYMFLQPDDNTISYADLHIESRKRSGSSIVILDEIENCIRACDGRKAEQLLVSVTMEMKEGNYSIEYCENLLSDIVTTIRRVVKSMGFSSTQLFGCDIREKFKDIRQIDEFFSWACGLIQMAVSTIEERKQSIDQHLEFKVKSYIEERLYDDLSLELVADHMNVSANYLGKLFKISTGIKFTEYLTERRLSEAVKLLKARQLSVNEIAGKLGYSSTNHFIRIFKEKYGETPKQYQKWL
ncbi:AraC family transcriptional regulator [Paenibacillus sp. FSL H8-0034]|uniref:AraC family transcriptional regulator n=1 Tax=Paenibacillus sp. FSL H8-0034 TaxID=2954671 RepID=UPI0030F72082